MQKELIQDTLISLGMSPNLKGFKYIVDAVALLDKPEWKNVRWNSLYYAVGVLNDSPATNVESNIRTALKIIRSKNINHSKVEYFLGFCNCDNSSTLALLHTRLKQTEKKNNMSYDKLLMKQALRELLDA